MEVFTFEAIGTKWHITIDGESFRTETKEAILKYVACFEDQFSRFIEGNEATQFRNAEAGTYQISDKLKFFLERAKEISDLTEGRYDPSVGKLLELAGYDKEYSFTEKNKIGSFAAPSWCIENGLLALSGSVVFDFGGIGKGFCIDEVAYILKNSGYSHYLVEAGGDMYGTTKADGSGWKVALEWPNQAEKVFGVIELKNKAIAVSDSFRRSWKNWHHIVNPQLQKSVERVLSCVAVSKTAFDADCATSGFFLASSISDYSSIGQAFQSEYVVFQDDYTVRVSSSWSGELF